MNGVKMQYDKLYDDLIQPFQVYLAFNQLIIGVVFMIFAFYNIRNFKIE